MGGEKERNFRVVLSENAAKEFEDIIEYIAYYCIYYILLYLLHFIVFYMHLNLQQYLHVNKMLLIKNINY